MNKTIVIYIKAAGAFVIPAGAAMGAGITPFALGTVTPNHWGVLLIILAALGAGYNGLNSFLSRSYADHQDEQDEPVDGNTRDIQILKAKAGAFDMQNQAKIDANTPKP